MHSLVGWAKALAGPSMQTKDSRAPCPRVHRSKRIVRPCVGTAHERSRGTGRRCPAPLPTLRFHWVPAYAVAHFAKTKPTAAKTGGGPAVVPPGPLAYQPTCKPGSVGRRQ